MQLVEGNPVLSENSADQRLHGLPGWIFHTRSTPASHL